MFVITLILVVMLAIAAVCAIRLTRPTVQRAPRPEVSPMKAALERRMREGGDLPF